MSEWFSRSEALLGGAAMARLAAARALVVGVGGVGSWCAEALVRTGLGKITLVDDDVVAESNVNRQCPATAATVGRAKVEAMAERLRAINPGCEVVGIGNRYPLAQEGDLPSEHRSIGASDHGRNFSILDYDVVVDAIDSVDCKAELILAATEAGVPVVSSMGAALRTDPTKVKVTRFEKVEGDGLARALRQRFKKLQRFPKGKFSCVWSSEPPVTANLNSAVQFSRTFETTENAEGHKVLGSLISSASSPLRNSAFSVVSKGSLMQVTATFGMCLASEAIRILTKGEDK